MNRSRLPVAYSLGLDLEEVRISSYCHLWPTIFLAEKKRIESGLTKTGTCRMPAGISIKHVGSTSVPGCSAKPVMDMIACYQSAEDRDTIVIGLMDLDYLYLGECGRQGRDFFVFNRGRKTFFHLHLVPADHPLYWDLLHFRRRLITSSDERNSYIRFKNELAERFPNNRTRYRMNKERFFGRASAPLWGRRGKNI